MYNNYVIDPNVYGDAVADALERKNSKIDCGNGVPDKLSTKLFFSFLWLTLMLFMITGPFIVLMGIFGWMVW